MCVLWGLLLCFVAPSLHCVRGVNMLVQADVVAEALALAKTIASQSPEAVRSCLRSIRMKQDEGLDKALWREADSQATNFASRDLREGVSATAEKRVPDFRRYDQYHFEQLRRGDE